MVLHSRQFYKILSLLLGLFTAFSLILFSLPSPAITTDDIDAMSSQTTVLIGQVLKTSDGGQETFNPGSGVIVARKGNNYYAVTNTHVVKRPNPDVLWGVVTWDKQFHEVSDVGDNIIRFGEYQSRELPIAGFDLALVKFVANQDYPLAVMGNSEQIHINEPVYLSGWPKPEDGSARIVRVFSPGQLVKVEDTPFSNGGYNIMYDNWTKPGMSGSAVFNQQGELIGIHAAGRRKGDNYCIDPELNLNSSCGIQGVHLIGQLEAKRIKLAFNPPPVKSSVIAQGQANKAEADVIEDVYKIFNRVESQLRDCPTGVLIDQPGCESLF